MKSYLLKKRIFAIIFMLTVFGYSALNIQHTYEPLMTLLKSLKTIDVAEIENEISSNLYERIKFIETYAYIQVLLDKRECNNFTMIRDEQNYLHYASFFREGDTQLFEYAMRVKRLQDYVEANGTKVLFVVAPSKYSSKYSELRAGTPINNPESTVTELLFYLNRLGIETLNLGETMPNEDLSYKETFFKSDHHWTIPAAFYATQKVTEQLHESFGLDLDPEHYYMNPDSYQQVTYYGGMLGSMGRKTGACFSGVDDFTAFWPTFEGDFHRESMTNDGAIVKSKGSFVKAFMNLDALTDKEDLYSGSQYSLYLNELRIYEKITNDEKPDGCKMFMIRDSYFSPVIAFMMPMCGEIDAIWSLEESDYVDIETYVRNNQFDYIIIEVYPYNINSEAFNYFKEKE